MIVIDFTKGLKRSLSVFFLFLCCFLQVKHLDSIYEPSTKRSDCWLKLKKAPTQCDGSTCWIEAFVGLFNLEDCPSTPSIPSRLSYW